VLNIWFDKTG